MAKGRKKDATVRGVDDDGGAASSQSVNAEVGFAKLQGEDFEYYMQTYSIILGRNSKTSEVDVDLASLGGGMNISRHHARIFYDFVRRRFALEVLGKNGCLVEGVLYIPGTPPVKLDSQDLLQMGEKQFYFLLPTRSLFGGETAPVTRQLSGAALAGCADLVDPRGGGIPVLNDEDGSYDEDDANDEEEDEEEEEEAEEDDDVRESIVRNDGKRLRGFSEDEPEEAYRRTSNEKPSRRPDTKAERRSRADREADNQRLLVLEEKEVITSVTTVLSDLCRSGEWVSVEKLHAELLEEFGNLWHHSRVRRYLTSEEWPTTETNGKPWHGLLLLLRKYPQHFVINKSKGRSASEFISLVSLIS